MVKIGITRKITHNVKEILGSILWRHFSETIFIKHSLTVLMLHRVTQDEHKIVGDPYLTISEKKLANILDVILKKIEVCDLYKRPYHLPERGFSITFDDGWKDNYDFAKQYFFKRGIPFTIFLTTGLIGTNQNFWFHSLDILFDSVAKTEIISFFKNTLPEPEKITNVYSIINELKKLPFTKIDNIIEKAEKKFNLNIKFSNVTSILNWEQVAELADAGVTFGSHGVRHAIMPTLNRNEKLFEAEQSWKILSEKVRTFIPVYSFPNGNYSKECVEICKKSGYEFGLSANFQMQQYDESFKIIPRISICESMSINLIKFRICLAHMKRKVG